MKNEMTYAEMMVEVLKSYGGIATLEEIYKGVVKMDSDIQYKENYKTSLRVELQRHCPESEKKHNRGEDLFYFARGKFNGVYGLLEYRMIDEPLLYRKDRNNKPINEILDEVRNENENKKQGLKGYKKLYHGKLTLEDRHAHVCQICGQLDENAKAHYIKPLNKHGEDKDNNKIVLCKHCCEEMDNFNISINKLEFAQQYSHYHEISIENVKWYTRYKEMVK